MDRNKIIEIITSNSITWDKTEIQDKVEIYLDDFVDELLEAINYNRCCKSDSEQLKCEHKYGQLKDGIYTCFDCGHKEEW